MWAECLRRGRRTISTVRAPLGASLCLLLAACATAGADRRAQVGGLDDAWAPWPGSAPADWRPFPRRLAVAATGSGVGALLARRAGELAGLASLKGVARHLPDDCTGLARAVYEVAGVELTRAAQPGDSGVSAMYRLAWELGALHAGTPAPGDLIFFVETYDRNRDGLRNDGLTHVAIVESVDADGTVTFVHRASSGVTRSHLNLSRPGTHALPDGTVLNDWLRPKSRITRAWFTGELFAGYASAEALVRSSSPAVAARARW